MSTRIAALALAAALTAAACGAGDNAAVTGAPLSELGASKVDRADAAVSSTTATTRATTTTAKLTTTAAPTTTQPAPTTTTTAPLQAPLHFEGAGDAVLEVGVITRAVTFRATHDGRRNFMIHTYDANGERDDSLVNEIGPYSGTTMLSLYKFDKPAPTLIEIKADGFWTLDITDLREATRWDGASPISGIGDSVFVASPSTAAARPVAWAHDGSSNFIVHWVSGRSVSGGVNEIGVYQGTALMPKGVFLVVVLADGNWSATPT